MNTDLTKTKSWSAAQTAKEAFCAAHKSKAPDCAAKRVAYTRALQACLREAGVIETRSR